MEKLLIDLNVNASAKIKRLNTTDQKLLRRFFELGLIVGQNIKVICVAGKKSAMLVNIRNYTLALDSDTCSMVVVDE